MGVLNRNLLWAQLDIIGVLNGKLLFNWKLWCAQWEIIMCSTENYYVLNRKLLCAQWEIVVNV